MANYDVNSVVQFGRLKEFGQGIAAELSTMKEVSASAFKSAKVVGKTVYFYTSDDMSGTPAFTFDFPSELVLDALKTTFVPSFAFNPETYPGATNPSLEGKPVLVIAVNETGSDGTVTTTYSFLNLESLVDTYVIALGDSAKVLSISGNVITFHVSSQPNNALTVQADGLHVNISGKVDKVSNATAGNLPLLTAEGGISDSGYAFATTADVTELIGELFPQS